MAERRLMNLRTGEQARCEGCGAALILEDDGVTLDPGEAYCGGTFRGGTGFGVMHEFGVVRSLHFCQTCMAGYPAHSSTGADAWLRGFLEARQETAYHAGKLIGYQHRPERRTI